MFQNRGKSICLDRSGDIHLCDAQAAPSSSCEMIILRSNSRELQEFVWEYLRPEYKLRNIKYVKFSIKIRQFTSTVYYLLSLL